jgi:hypothetical protein
MRALNDLVIRGPGPEVTAFLRRLEGSLSGGWRRDRTLEARLHSTGVGDDRVFCFVCDDAPGRPAAALWLRPRGPDDWYASNIVPLGRRPPLSDEEYNHILGEFQSRFIEPLSRGSAVHSEVLPARIRLEYYLSPEAARRLRDFSAAANRTSLSPSDWQRWQQFLVRAHRDESPLDTPFLEEWLASEGWPDEARAELARDYESTRRLLWNYDEELRR